MKRTKHYRCCYGLTFCFRLLDNHPKVGFTQPLWRGEERIQIKPEPISLIDLDQGARVAETAQREPVLF